MLLRASSCDRAGAGLLFGAVMVLFLFVVMMLDVRCRRGAPGLLETLPAGRIHRRFDRAGDGAGADGRFRLAEAPPPDPRALELGNSKMLGIEIYTHYLYPLQVAAVLLLVAIIAAIALTLRQRKDSRRMDPSLQVRAKKADRVRLVRCARRSNCPRRKSEGKEA